MSWNETLRNKLNKSYVGKKIIDLDDANIDDKLGINYVDYGDIEVTLVSKPYLSEDEMDALEEDENEYDEQRNWAITHEIHIELDSVRNVQNITISDRIWGDSGLGAYDPRDFYSEYEYFELAEIFMKAIVE